MTALLFPRWLPASMIAAGLTLSTGLAHADEPRFEVTARGATVQASMGMSRAGYRIMGDLGGESVGLRSFGRHWLVGWDVLVAGRLGELANREPYLFLFGLRASSSIEPTYRVLTGPLSPAVFGRLSGDASVMFNTVASLADAKTLNDMDGVGGVNTRGQVRIGGGLSYLEMGKSLLLQGFVEELLVGHGVNADGKAFTDVGLAARFDWTWGLSAALEGSYGTTLSLSDPALDRTLRTSRFAFGGNARKIFGNGMWLGLFASIARETEHVTYSRTTFDGSGPADVTLGLAFGISLWRPR